MVAENYPPSAHTGRMNKSGHALRIDLSDMSPVRTLGYPTPSPCGNLFSTTAIACNSHILINLQFLHSNESVTENPKFCPFLWLFWGQIDRESAVFRRFLTQNSSWPAIRKLHDQPSDSKSAARRRRFSRTKRKKAYNADSISKPQASRSASGMYLEFLLRRAHSRRRVERIY